MAETKCDPQWCAIQYGDGICPCERRADLKRWKRQIIENNAVGVINDRLKDIPLGGVL